MAGAIGFENIASGIGGVTIVAYFSALCDLRFTASSTRSFPLQRVLRGACSRARPRAGSSSSSAT